MRKISVAHNSFISNQEAIPIVETGVFERSGGLPLAIARIRAEDVISGDDAVALGYAQLRANVYIDQTNILDPSSRRADGGESDADDHRSVHLVGLEDRGDGKAAVVASMRLIHKTHETPEDLPFEGVFAEDLAGKDITKGSFEVSRYIAKNDNRRRVIMSKIAIVGSGLAHAVKNGWGPSFAVVEPSIESDLTRIGVPVSRVTEPRFIEMYDDVNVGIEIDLQGYAAKLGEAAIKDMYVKENGIRFFGDKR